MSWKLETFGSLLTESKIPCEIPDSDKRIRVKLNVKGVEKRPDTNDKKGATKQYIRTAGQFIYGKQNLFKGAFGIIPRELDGFESSSDIPAFDISKECLPEWIYYYFKQGDFYKGLEKYSKGTGSRRIHPDKIAHLEIPLPSLKEQKKILQKINSVQNEIKQLSQNVSQDKELLTSLRQSILSEAVQGKLVPQNPKDEPASELLKKIKKEKEKLIKEKKIKKGKELPPIEEDEIPYELPKGWVWTRLGEVCNLITDGSHNPPKGRKEGIPMISATNVLNDKIVFNKKLRYISEEEYEIERKRNPIERGDILLTIVGTIGRTCVVNIKNKFCLQRSVALIKSEINSKYLSYYLRSPLVLESFIERGKGTAQKGIYLGKLNETLLPLPSLPEQKRIVEKVDTLMRFCDKLELRIKENKESSEKLMGAVLREVFK